MPARIDPKEAEATLRALFARNGYVRRADADKRRAVGAQVYKKGYEVRLVLESAKELQAAKRSLRAVGIKGGAPFAKHGKVVQPIYGRAAVEWFGRR